MTNKSSDIPRNLQNSGNVKNRSFCLYSVTSTSGIHGVETRPIQHCKRYNAATMDQISLYILTNLLDKLNPPRSFYQANGEADSCDTNMAPKSGIHNCWQC